MLRQCLLQSKMPLALLLRSSAHQMASSSSAAAAIGAQTSAADGPLEDADQREKEREQRQQNDDKQRRRYMRAFKVMSAFGAAGLVAVFYDYGLAPRDPETGAVLEDKHSGKILAPVFRVADQFAFWRSYFAEPSRDKLLPDPVKPPWHQPKHTVVIEMRNILVSPQWDYKRGHHFVKRPALDYFLDVAGYPNFELVIFTQESAVGAAPIVQQLDPQGQRISHALFRDCTKYANGAYIKDLSHLNRDLRRVIYIDWDPQAYQLNPDNVLRVPKWAGDTQDTWLVELAELLKTIHLQDVDDVRPVLQFYSQFDNPMAEFRRRAKQIDDGGRGQGAFQTLEQTRSSTPDDGKNNNGSMVKKYGGSLFGANRHRI